MIAFIQKWWAVIVMMGIAFIAFGCYYTYLILSLTGNDAWAINLLYPLILLLILPVIGRSL